MTAHVWHRWKHDDFTVTEFTFAETPDSWLQQAKKRGGLWDGGKFILWHCITWIEFTLMPAKSALTPPPKGEREG